MFTYKGKSCGAHPDDIIPINFGGDGVKKVWQDLGMSEQERLDCIFQYETYKIRQLRNNEYPPITDYLDGVVKGDQAQIDKYIADCLAVKAKYPKPE